MKASFLIAALAIVSYRDACAETISALAVRGAELSTIYGISDVDQVTTPTAKVRVYTMSVGEELARETLVLQVVADSRPYRMRGAVVVWDIGDVLWSVESVALVDDAITIRGMGDGGRRVCRYAFTFEGSDLSKELTVLGCALEP
jgi:hypothetical protein